MFTCMFVSHSSNVGLLVSVFLPKVVLHMFGS